MAPERITEGLKEIEERKSKDGILGSSPGKEKRGWGPGAQ